MSSQQPADSQPDPARAARPGGTEFAVDSQDAWMAHRARILANMQLVMGALRHREATAAPSMHVLDEEDLGEVVRRRITYAADDGDRVPAYLLLPRKPRGRTPGVLCLHQTTTIGKGEPAGIGGLTDLHYALELARHGFVTLAPDYPRFGDYSLDVYALGYESATMKGVCNHMRAVDLLQSLPEVEPERIGCIGHSLGGHNTIFASVFDGRIKAAVSSCGFTSFAKYCGGDLTGWSHEGYMPRIADDYGRDASRMPFDFTDLLAALAPRPFFANAPLHDDNFDASGVDDCVLAALPVYRLYGAQDRLVVAHPDTGHAFPPETRRAAYRFLDAWLR